MECLLAILNFKRHPIICLGNNAISVRVLQWQALFIPYTQFTVNTQCGFHN